MSGDRLAGIEQRPVSTDSNRRGYVILTPEEQDTLVEIAKAARAAEKYVLCVTDPPCGDCDACRFHAALARLDSGAAE